MLAHRPTILITGFGAFPGVPVNATSLLAPLLAEAARARFPAYRAVAHLLPTEWRAAPMALDEMLTQEAPELVLHFGVSSRADGFAVEARARNRCALSADACGELPPQACIADDSPEFLAATIPTAHIVKRLRERGLPAAISRDAGAYLCNAVLYHALSRPAARGISAGYSAGFVHVPTNLLDVRPGSFPRSNPRCRLDWDGAVEGGLEIISAAIGRPAANPGDERRTRANLSSLPLR